MKIKFILLILGILILSTSATAVVRPDHVLANSNDWRDVYSTTIYGNLLNTPNDFLTSTRHATLILFAIPQDREHVQAITSSNNRFIVGYEDILRNRGYDEAEELIFNNVNLELARLLDNTNRFIVMDDSYGYNAISAAPYAIQAGYYVLFADELNIDQVSSFLSERGVDDLIIFGQVDREVRQELEEYNPEIINEGDRFDNNLAMVEKYLTIKPSQQAILTNGEFIEDSIMSGKDPVVFIGRANVPDKVREFIQGSSLDVGILVGNELIGSATFIRRQIGISVFVKFAQGSRQPTGPIAKVEDLDRFPMPRYELDLSVESVVYNRATDQLEVTYSNNVDLAAYFSGTITVTSHADGSTTTAGDENPIFIDGGDIKTVTYNIEVPGGGANASVFTIYGESEATLENELEGEFEIEYVEVRDDSKVNVTDLKYDQGEGRFYVTIKNTGDVRSYADIEIANLMINEQPMTIGADEIVDLSPGEKMEVPVTIEMDDEDISDNPTVTVRTQYGERRLALIKESTNEFEFEETAGNFLYYALIIVILILLFLIFRKRKKDEEK